MFFGQLNILQSFDRRDIFAVDSISNGFRQECAADAGQQTLNKDAHHNGRRTSFTVHQDDYKRAEESDETQENEDCSDGSGLAVIVLKDLKSFFERLIT